MRGSIIKQAPDSYTIIVSVKDAVTGKRKQHWITVRGAKKDAERRRTELLHQLDSGMFFSSGKTTFAEFCARWLAEFGKTSLSPRTYECYEHIIKKHLVPSLGQIPLLALKPEHLQRYYADKLNGGLAARTVRYHHVTAHNILKFAVKWGLIPRNPADATDPPTPQKVEMHFMSEDDVNKFLEAAKKGEYYGLFFTAIFTGLRRSELLALKWNDLDLDLCQLSVSKGLHQLRTGKIIERQPKTASGKRMVALTPANAITLREHKKQQSELRMKLGLPALQEADYVFSHFDGRPLLPASISHAWMKLARRTGLKGIHLHSARHSHASLMLKQGIHPKVVQSRLGHASISTTLDIYSHVMPGLQEAAAMRFDDILPKQKTSLEKELEKIIG